MASFPIETESLDEFYVRYYVGHKGRFGHEFIEFELVGLSGKLRYANNSNYAGEKMIRKEVYVSPAVVQEVKRIVEESEITKEGKAIEIIFMIYIFSVMIRYFLLIYYIFS